MLTGPTTSRCPSKPRSAGTLPTASIPRFGTKRSDVPARPTIAEARRTTRSANSHPATAHRRSPAPAAPTESRLAALPTRRRRPLGRRRGRCFPRIAEARPTAPGAARVATRIALRCRDRRGDHLTRRTPRQRRVHCTGIPGPAHRRRGRPARHRPRSPSCRCRPRLRGQAKQDRSQPRRQRTAGRRPAQARARRWNLGAGARCVPSPARALTPAASSPSARTIAPDG